MRTQLALYYRRLASKGSQCLGDSLLLAVLIPIGWLYGVVNFIRAWLYQQEWLTSYCSPVPVISVGNLAVGGTGKTPLVDYLLSSQLQRGRRVAVVSRGYGSEKGAAVRVVCAGDGPLLSAQQCGDEPYLLARRNPEAVVIIAPQRSAGIRHAIEQFNIDLVLLDDGYQHLAVQRDLNLLLLDSGCPLGNGYLLPAGLLREFPSAATRADLCIFTRYKNHEIPLLPCAKPVVRATQQLANSAQDLLGNDYSVEQLRQGCCVAFAGIASPDSFFIFVIKSGIVLQNVLPLPDHCVYSAAVIEQINAMANEADFLLTTEKDAVKLDATQFSVPCCSFPLIFEPQEVDVLEQHVEALFVPRIK
ncbi:MAG: tetraacyldisaccharide 4'-kinase [Thermodesulfobacteriota bacterium]|nr:tetraacyldisaccharide 4'-kinase [Thermodesulfobacteriota bacterium]